MKLKLSRSQKEKGMIGKTIVFCLDARVELTPEEQDAIKRYHLGSQAIYNSAASRDYLDSAANNISQKSFGGALKGMAALAMSKMQLNITIDSLTQGHHIECKDLEEVLGAESAIQSACQHMKGYIETAQMFNGEEEVIEI